MPAAPITIPVTFAEGKRREFTFRTRKKAEEFLIMLDGAIDAGLNGDEAERLLLHPAPKCKWEVH